MTVAVAHQANKAGAAVLSAAVEEASLRGVPLAVIYAVTTADLDDKAALRQGIGELVHEAASNMHIADVEWELHLAGADSDSIEDTAYAILAEVAAVGADLLVLGARRRSPVGKAILGSITQEILLDVAVPVLVVKAPGT
ncbi:MAG: universal stress protein [Nostocoides sp.]